MDMADSTSCTEREKCVIVILDEMHVRENLVYDKHTGMYHVSVIVSIYIIMFCVFIQVTLLGSPILVR